jgi:hypothetical protein
LRRSMQRMRGPMDLRQDCAAARRGSSIGRCADSPRWRLLGGVFLLQRGFQTKSPAWGSGANQIGAGRGYGDGGAPRVNSVSHWTSSPPIIRWCAAFRPNSSHGSEPPSTGQGPVAIAASPVCAGRPALAGCAEIAGGVRTRASAGIGRLTRLR